MRHLRAAAVCVSMIGGAAAGLIGNDAAAAEITRVASSFEENDPFSLFFDIGFERTQEKIKIVREQHQDGQLVDATEVFYKGVDSRLNFDAHVGLYRDFEFRIGLPIVFTANETYRYVSGTSDENSSITNNCLQANGDLTDPNCPSTGVGAQPLFAVPGEVYRGGVGNLRLGFSYAFFNEKRDDTKPTWVVSFDYEAPTAELLDPTEPTSRDARGDIGDKIHKYTFATALSKRMGAADPYFKLWYTLPFRGPGWYSNCDDPDPRRMARPENCGSDVWSREESGISPPHRAGIVVGTELIAFDQPESFQKFAIDVRAIANYVSEGRYYNPLSGVLNKLLWTGDYAQVGGHVGIVANAAEYFNIRASGSLLYNTDHFLTDEEIGKDVDGNGRIQLDENPEEISPTFDYRVDTVSRRFRATEDYVFQVNLAAEFNF